MKTIISLIKLCMFLMCLVLLLFNSIDYRTATVKVIDSRNKIHTDSTITNFIAQNEDPQNWESTIEIIGGSHYDKGLLLIVNDKLTIDDTLFAQYNHFYDVTWISNGYGHKE